LKIKKMDKKRTISHYIPKIGKDLSNYSGKEIIDKLGDDVIRNVVISVLSGGNVRALTESLTRRRLNLSNASMLITYIHCLNNIEDFCNNLNDLVADELKNVHLDKESKIFLNWIIGLTGKGIQNVLRSDDTELLPYLNDLNEALQKSVKESINTFGEITTELIDKNNQKYFLKWPELLQLFTAIGTQTLSIRGSEKSMYGKFFEKLILGSLLTILGFNIRNESNKNISSKLFWLSERNNKRESDATVLLKPGVGARFDIGFIGPGNTEISLDKVSRFEREIEYGRQKYYMSTIIIVDRIGEGSRIREMAKAINGDIVQMSMTYWVKEIATILYKKLSYSHDLLKYTNEESIKYIKKCMQNVDMKLFV